MWLVVFNGFMPIPFSSIDEANICYIELKKLGLNVSLEHHNYETNTKR